MKILHTSDWHLGRSLNKIKKRYSEFKAFLDWLAQTINDNSVEVLIVAGDIFDNNTPTNQAQELYYNFLKLITRSSCRHVVITAGNHDSVSFLEAPSELLKMFDIHIVGRATEELDREVITLHDPSGKPELIVCAVPYLRDKDIRLAEVGETPENKEKKLTAGMAEHYRQIAELAVTRRQELQADIPIVAMGHLFVIAGQTASDDGVRELYAGALAHINPDIFSNNFSYVALGHLHTPQTVKGSANIRYSGSPLPMGFNEAKQQKSLCLVDISTQTEVKLIDIPTFQELEKIRGDWNQIKTRLEHLKSLDSKAWLNIVYAGNELIGDLRQKLEEVIGDSPLEVITIQNEHAYNLILIQNDNQETLSDLSETDVFERCLTGHAVPDEQKTILRQAYQEILDSIENSDPLSQ